MVETDFVVFREALEDELRQPPFEVIRTRRRRRSARLAAGGAALAVVLLIAGVAAAGLRPTDRPAPAPAVTGPVRAQLVAVAATPSKVLYAVVNPCGADCPLTLVASKDLGRQWTRVSTVDGADGTQHGRLYATDATHLWMLTADSLVSSTDGGKTWRAPWHLTRGDRPLLAAVGDGRLWLVVGGRLYRSTGAGGLEPTQAPADAQAVAPAGPGRALVRSGGVTWYSTIDDGAHWTPAANPCDATAVLSTMSIGPDGTRWAVCVHEPVTDNQPKELRVSTDGGNVWYRRGTLESSGYGTDVYPVSATVAWRTGPRSDIHRTTDGTQWTDTAHVGGTGGPDTFVALDADTALYSAGGAVYLTRDGGRTWTDLHFVP